jgi:two-component system, cell cycle sensor histidine kinase and response regulator CckA
MTERRGLETQLRQAQKMEALGTLAGGIAHDFNNILAAAVGYLELVRMDAEDRPEILENLNEVTKATTRATDLVRQILAFSRRSHQEYQPLRLQQVVEECLKLLRSTLPASIQINTALQPEPLTVQGDQTQIHQVIMNLCTNAAHAMRAKPGTLTVRLEAVQVSAGFARSHPELKAGHYAKLVVADTGHGMTQEVLDRIYDPFFTTKGPGEGTGLGLSVVHGIVKAHRGAILVASQPGEGTTFEVFIPLAEAPATTAQGPSATVPSGHNEHILYVDDEAALCKVASKLLRSWGYQVSVQTQPTEAVRQVQAQPHSFDLVITDLSMPALSGVDLAAELHKIQPKMPIILTSGYAAGWAPEWKQNTGIKELLLKPVSPADLRAAVDRVLHSQAHIGQ